MAKRCSHLIGTGHLFRKKKNFWVLLASKSQRRIQLMNMIGISPLYICPSLFEENLDKSDFPNAEMYVLENAMRKGKDVVKRIWSDEYVKKECEIEKPAFCEKSTTVKIEDMNPNSVDALEYCSKIINKEIHLSPNANNAITLNPLPQIIISCDTIVVLNNEIIEKPKNKEDAFKMLKKLSANMHTVYTAVCIFLFKKNKHLSFVEKTNVYFDELSDADIEQYLILNEAYDKAGGYGIQGFGSEFIKKIDGCFYNVMGLPVSKLSTTLAYLYEDGCFTFE